MTERNKPSGRASCLEHQAAWRCRHSGACCSAGWTIPIEGPAFERVGAHFGGRMPLPLFRTGGPLPEGAAAALEVRADGACVFFDAEGGRLCSIHRELGVDALPLACRQFPRQVLKDARGVLIALSHYCPTTAGMTADAGPLRIVEAPASLALEDLDGLDATRVLPPLVHPQMLADMDGYEAWEQLSLDALDRTGLTAAEAVGAIAAATARVMSWRPGSSSLRDAVHAGFDGVAECGGPLDRAREDELVEVVRQSVPPGLDVPDRPRLSPESWRAVDRWLAAHDRAVRVYLGTRLFGNWIAYYGQGLLAIVYYLSACLAVLRSEAARQLQRHEATDRERLVEALRSSDLLLVHLSDARTLARLLTTV